MERLDTTKSYIFMLNHASWFDIFIVYGWLPFFFKWIMKADLRRIPFVGAACAAAGHIFIDRENPKAAQESLEKAKQELQKGISVVIFPEGTRTKTGKLGKFKRGGFKIAVDLGLPIVPITLCGCFERMPRNTLAINPGVIEMHVHEPLDMSGYTQEDIPELMQKTREIIEFR
jgi:1-acyl-sn-glycerol-3-phosphate acyltransferase